MCFPKSFDTNGIILLLIGLDSSGKSSFLMRLRNGSGTPPKSGWGFSVDMVQYKPAEKSWFRTKRKMVKIYDLGGDQQIRGIWKNYLAEVRFILNYKVHGCIYVVDGDDKNRLTESKDALIDIYQNAKLSGKPLLLYVFYFIILRAVNHKGEIDKHEVFEKMNLQVLFPDGESAKSLRIQFCDVSYNPHTEPNIDPRIREGFNWIVASIQEQMKILESRRRTDIKQEIKEKIDRRRTVMIMDKDFRRTKTKIVPIADMS